MKIKKTLSLLFALVMLFNTIAVFAVGDGEDAYETFPFIVTKNINKDGTVDVTLLYMKNIPTDAQIDVEVTDEGGDLAGVYNLTKENDRIVLEKVEKNKLLYVTINEKIDGEEKRYSGIVDTKYTDEKEDKTDTKSTISVSDDKNDKRENNWDEWIENIVNNLSEKSELTVGATSKKYYFGHVFTFNKKDLDEQKEVTEKFLTTVLKLAGNELYDSKHKCKKPTYDEVFTCSIFVGDDKLTRVDITICDEHMKFLGECYYVEDTAEIIEYAVKLWNDEFEVFDCDSRVEMSEPKVVSGKIDFENEQFVRGSETKAFKYQEKIEFDIKLDKTFDGTFLEEYAKIGEKVHCTVQNLWSGSMFFILTIEGSKGTGQYWENVRGGELGKGFSGGETGRILRFLRVHRVEDGLLMEYDMSPVYQYDRIEIQGSLEKEDVAGATLQWMPCQLSSSGAVSNITPSNAAEGFNIDYEYYGTAEELKNGRNIYKLFGIEEKEIEIPKILAETKDLKEQDPKRYVTELRYEEDGEKLDYYIGFIAQMSVDFGFSNSNTPSWYRSLGENVRVTLVGFTQTVNGKDRHNWSMLRFSGDKGTKWFNLGLSEACDALVKGEYNTEEKLSVYMEFNELISFDGEQMIRNTVEFDTTKATVNFRNDGSLELESIVIGAGLKEATVFADDIKYIGGGKVEYEKLW